MTETPSSGTDDARERYFRDLFEFAPDGYLVTDLESRVLVANRAARRLFRVEAGEMDGLLLAERVVEEDRRVFDARIDALASGRARRVQDWQLRFARKPVVKGGEPTFDAELTVERTAGRTSEGGDALSWLLRDVTQRRRAEEMLRQQKARASAILESAVDGFITVDTRGIIHSANPAAQRIFGYSEEEMLGRNVKMLMPEPDRSRHDGYVKSYVEGGEPQIIGMGREVTGQRSDGTVFPMDLAVSEVRVGEKLWFMGTVRDITERKETERALRRERDFAESLVETAQAIVLLLDTEGRIVRYNRYMEEISGVPLREVEGKDWFQTFIPRDEQNEVRDVFDTALGGESTRGNVSPLLTRDGETKEIEWFDTVLRDDKGEVTGILAVGQDLTPRKTLEEQVRQAQKLEAIGRLAGGVAHDFNTLLGSITGYAEMLLDRVDHEDCDPEIERPARQIHRAAERGAALTKQLLAFSRRQVLQPKILDLNAVVSEMEGFVHRLLDADIRLEQRLHPEPLPVRIDVSQMEQVIMNLVVNACDAMPRGGRILIETTVEPQEDDVCPRCEGRCVQLRVSDTGHGMEDAVLSRIFEPFFTTKEPGKGTGLGLSTVYGIVAQSQGQVRVESEVGEGSTFVICLPPAQGELEEESATEIRSPEGGSETVLLVEDDRMFLELLAEVLETKGYRVWTAGTPQEALELCDRGEGTLPDLLVSDMVMPGGMTGAELAEVLRQTDPSLRVLLMSGYTDEDLAKRGAGGRIEEPASAGGASAGGASAGGASAFIHKPFGTKEFASQVRELLDAE